ncbi:hypothetical protein TIFTF001_006902 [Ficus carica]|uniref:Uncharacterized protein n=1 Tax=Ficus carica TaxID=3494 RepID=A0AA88AC83_FICCA|nr:hypothetical protein TIFTF001_006902 [Ficus carica]
MVEEKEEGGGRGGGWKNEEEEEEEGKEEEEDEDEDEGKRKKKENEGGGGRWWWWWWWQWRRPVTVEARRKKKVRRRRPVIVAVEVKAEKKKKKRRGRRKMRDAWTAFSAALFPKPPRLPPLSPVAVLRCCSFVYPFFFPCAFGLFSSVEASTSIIPDLFALPFTPNIVPFSSLGFNPKFWLLDSHEIPNSQISVLRFLPPPHIVDSSHRSWAPAVSIHRTRGLGTAGGQCGADWGRGSNLDDGFVLPTISDQQNQLNDRLLLALIRLHRSFTPPPARTP